MADPDAARLGYTYNPTRGKKHQYSSKPTYTPPPSQVGGAQSPSSQTPKNKHETMLEHSKQHPKGDDDHDGISNRIDPNPLAKNKPQHKTIVSLKEKWVKVGQGIDFNPLSGLKLGDPRPITETDTLPDDVKKQIEKFNKKDGKSYAVFRGANGEYLIRRDISVEKENPGYKRRLDLDHDGVSGTAADYRRLKKQDESPPRGPGDGDSPEHTGGSPQQTGSNGDDTNNHHHDDNPAKSAQNRVERSIGGRKSLQRNRELVAGCNIGGLQRIFSRY